MSIIAFDPHSPRQIHAASAASLRNATRRYGRATALDGLSFDLTPGSFTAVVGRSGAGKSVLLRLLAGEDPVPTGAELKVAKPVELVLPGAHLLPWRRVWGSVAEGLEGGWRSADDAQRIAAALSAVGLEEEARTWAIKLSDEDALRAVLARSLLREPKLLLIDDAFSQLPARARASLQRLLLSIWTERRPTILMATEDLNEALLLADRVLLLEEGRLIADVAVDLPRPRDPTDPDFSARRSELLEILGRDYARPKECCEPFALEVFL